MLPEVKTIRIDRAVFQQTMEKKLADLPPMPAVVMRIMHSINDPDISTEELNRLISMDQGLSSKVLRIVNSAYYGFPKRISTLTHAINILGFNTVRNLVLGVSAFGQLGQKSMPYGLNRDKFWEHSVAVAVTGSVIAKYRLARVRNSQEEAFIGGLLHDLGTLFLDSYFPVQYAVTMAFAGREKKTSQEAENMILGIDHCLVGYKIADFWSFPSPLAQVIGKHHAPTSVPAEMFDQVACIHAADVIAWQMGRSPSDHACPHEMAEAVTVWLGFEEQTLQRVMAEAEQEFDKCTALIQAIKEG